MAAKKGRQTPTSSFILPYKKSFGTQAVKLYEASSRKAIKWQKLLIKDIMGVNSDGLWIHQKFGYSVPRRNGKNEIIVIRELWGLEHGEQMCHTAHRTTTSRAAWSRLRTVMKEAGYIEYNRINKGELTEKHFKITQKSGEEAIELYQKGKIVFRTRSRDGGLGEGFDLLVIDEAQEYTTMQEGALVYTVSDSKNPQTILCGTPPTMESVGTVFPDMRKSALKGEAYETGWAEWGVNVKPENLRDVDLWRETNPSFGYHLDERKIRSEIRGDDLDFTIQRLGYWFTYSLKSAITEAEWRSLQVEDLPQLKGPLFVGIKYSHSSEYVAMSIAVRTEDGHIFIESIDCQSVRNGNGWMLDFLKKSDVAKVVVDGENGRSIMVDDMEEEKLMKPISPTVAEVIKANATFENGVFQDKVRHKGQPSLSAVVSNCEHRNIGSHGGFGYSSIKEGLDICLMESAVLAYWICSETKQARRRQRVSY